jgi:hypothetical protein
MSRTLFAFAVFIASLAVTIAAATAADTAPRKAENAASVDLYKDPG